MKTQRKVYVYKLIDPLTDEIFYIGRTQDIRIRHKCHILNTHNVVSEEMRFRINNIKLNNKIPNIEIIEECSSHLGAYRESYQILWHLKNGHILLNKVSRFHIICQQTNINIKSHYIGLINQLADNQNVMPEHIMDRILFDYFSNELNQCVCFGSSYYDEIYKGFSPQIIL